MPSIYRANGSQTIPAHRVRTLPEKESPAILPAMSRKPTIAIIGPGRLGRALGLELRRARYRISEIVSRDNAQARPKAVRLARQVGASVSTKKTARLDADLIWFCVPDREIASAARDLSECTRWAGKVAFHSSGAMGSDELEVLREQGAVVASVHPLMTFVGGSVPCLRGVPFGVEGDAAAAKVARRIIRDFGGEPFELAKRDKAAYHAWGAFTSPLLVSLLVNAEQVAKIAGFPARDARKKMLPILCQTLANYAALGPAGAFSGPLIRGDDETVCKHLNVLTRTPEAREVYLALARSALRHLPVRNRKDVEKALKSKA
jgi:predicted short-subunit dehydrogenase-like oxidoreductase (DUF2520 family)